MERHSHNNADTYPYEGRFRTIIDEYYQYLKNSPITDLVRNSSRYGIRIDLWVFYPNGTTISETKYATYSPWKIHQGRQEKATMKISLTNPMLKYNITKLLMKSAVSNRQQEALEEPGIGPLVNQVCVWELDWEISPEDLAEAGAPYTTQNGIKYIETPLEIVENYNSVSGILLASLETAQRYKSAFAVSIAVGYKLSEKVSSGSYNVGDLGVTLYKAGYSVEKRA